MSKDSPYFKTEIQEAICIKLVQVHLDLDHYAGLCILEQHCILLSEHEEINLSLIILKHPNPYYCSWEEMKKVIRVLAHSGSGLIKH